MTATLRMQLPAAALFLSAVFATGAAMAAGKIAVITPYLAQPGTQFYVEAFQAAAKDKAWDVNVIDTKGDVAAVISRLEDAATGRREFWRARKEPCTTWIGS